MTESKDPLQSVINEFKKLPGIGAKSAQRIAFYLTRCSSEECDELASSITELKGGVILCSKCNDISGIDPCRICSDTTREHSQICVVEKPFNVHTIEKGGHYRGTYHVLHGSISPLNGIGPEDLKIKNLFDRLREDEDAEVILATNPTIDGEATAHYLTNLIKSLGRRVSRIAFGIPVGSDLEYADEVTLSRAISGRTVL